MAKDRLAEVLETGRPSSASRSTPSSPRSTPRCSAAARSRSAASRTRACARCASACRARCRCPTRRRSSRPCLRGWRPTARSRAGASSTASSTSIPTCPRTTRSPSTTCRSAPTAYVDVEVDGALAAERIDLERPPLHGRLDAVADGRRLQRRASASRASTSKRTPARWSTSAGARAASRAPPIARRLQPRRHAAHRARQRARHPHAGRGAPLRAEAAAHLAVARHLGLQHGGGLDARRRERVASARAARPSSAPRPRSRT